MTKLILLAAAAYSLVLGSVDLRAQTPAARTVWDGVFTDEQAARGTGTFASTCGNCHTLGTEGTRPLSGDKFLGRYTQRTVGDLLAFVQKNMPNGANAGTLSPSTYADLVALILRSNGLPAGKTELSAEAVANVQIVPKDGPGQLPAGTLVRVVGCLAKNGNDFVITNAVAPRRAEKTGTTPEDATAALGDTSIALKFLMTKLDANVGKRMSATGLLIGIGGADGLNVSTVTKVAETCP